MIRPLSAAALAATFLIGCTGSKPEAKVDTPASDPSKAGAPAAELTQLIKEDKKVGKGDAVVAGDTVYVRYRGYFKDGREFDGNMKGDKPIFNFVAGPTGGVIDGWKEGIIGMKEGGERKLSVPWKMAYGEQGSDSIPARTDLYFDIKLETILSEKNRNVVKRKDRKVGTGAALKEGQKATVDVRGELVDGTKVDEGKNFTFTVGKGSVIPGVDVGIVGMKVGGVRELTIPPSAGYGPMGRPPVIMGNTVVRYILTLKKIG